MITVTQEVRKKVKNCECINTTYYSQFEIYQSILAYDNNELLLANFQTKKQLIFYLPIVLEKITSR